MAERIRTTPARLCLLALGTVLSGLGCGGGDITTPTVGSLHITTATTGLEPDADGYAVSIDGGAETPLGVNASLQRDNLEPGNHSVRLTGMAANCTLAGDNPRTIGVASGETATLAFQLTCSATTGSLALTASTSGPSPDPDGYSITLDGADRGTLAASGAVTLDGLIPGTHTIGLSGVAANCQVEGENPRIAAVTAGASATVAFAITCAAPPPNTGTLRVVTSTTGPEPDADGYTFAVDGGTSQPIGVSGTASLANAPTGGHTVQLSGVARNCTVQGTNPRLVTIAAGATAEVRFAVACIAATGRIQITTTSTGNAPDADGYTVAVDDAAPQTIGATATLAVSGVSPGAHRVTLAGLTWNCQIEGDNPRSVTVTAGAGTTVAFSLNCYAPLIAFTSDRDGNSAIYVMRADGSGQTRLTDGRQPAWSPDGSKIAYSCGGICVINADGSGQTRLTSNLHDLLGWDESPTWSPDVTKIAFLRYTADVALQYGYAIMVMNADGTGITQLSTEDGYYMSPDWSRDGRRIAFTTWYEDLPTYIAMDNSNGIGGGYAEGGEGTCRDHPAWSTDGRIAFSSAPVDPEDDDGDDCVMSGNEIYVMNPDGSGVVQLTVNTVADSDPAWSRDDGKIAFNRNHDGNSDIYVMNADGSGETRLTSHRAADFGPTWSP